MGFRVDSRQACLKRKIASLTFVHAFIHGFDIILPQLAAIKFIAAKAAWRLWIILAGQKPFCALAGA